MVLFSEVSLFFSIFSGCNSLEAEVHHLGDLSESMVAVHPLAIKTSQKDHRSDFIEYGKFMNHFTELNKPNKEIPGSKPEVFDEHHYTSGRTTKKLAGKLHFQLRQLYYGM